MATPTRATGVDRDETLPPVRLVPGITVAGLVLTAAGMLLQIAAGSKLYPTFAGPIVLLLAAVIVAFIHGRWTAYVAILVPLVLGVGAIIVAVMTGGFVEQLTDISHIGILLGSVMHVIGLIAATAGGVGMLLGRRGMVPHER
jgi:hypothetical protein